MILSPQFHASQRESPSGLFSVSGAMGEEDKDQGEKGEDSD